MRANVWPEFTKEDGDSMSTGREITVLLAASMIVLLAGRVSMAALDPPGQSRKDEHSFARPEQVRVTRVVLDVDVDFASKALKGTATLAVERRPGSPADAPLILDTRGLVILGVTAPDGEKPARDVEFSVGREDPVLGAALTIALPNDAKTVTIAYHTTARSSALQWLDPKGTAGGKQPFLFTQSEAIHARSWIPLQDSPSVRVTYSASVHVPDGLTAVMSADRGPVTREKDGRRTFRFEMPQPVPAYLIALAVGDLAFRAIGPRTGVFAEPSVVESAAREFADTEKMVETVEKRFGPYRWGRYDLLVLPPSFPFGGMENPKLTFATPTVLAGDRSLVSLVAHELAHSWSGNLVTNATWRDFWLNEGFTTYLERRVMEDLYGPGRAAMERVLGMKELRTELAAFPARDQVLHLDLAGRDPDEGMTRVPYEKGALFLTTVEQAVGRDRFDAFLRGYFDHFAFQSITTDDFAAYLRQHLLADDAAASRIDLVAWLDKPGLPAGAPEAKSDRFDKVETAAGDWSERRASTAQLATAEWTTQEWLHFLQSLPARLPTDRLTELDRAFDLTDRRNSEIAQVWLVIAVKNRYAPADARLDNFLTTIGRRKFLMPLYAELLKTPEGAAKAKDIYDRARSFYHPITVDSVDKLFAKSKAE
jgi:leukotriene-A4 hydrolase